MTVLVPTMIRMLVDHLEDHPADLTSLRFVHYGASPMSARTLRQAIRAFGCDFIQGYGMTEAGPGVGWLPAEDHQLALDGHHPERLGSAGHAIPGVQLEIRDSDAKRVDDGTIGEVWVRGPNIMVGYHKRPRETEQALTKDGWYRTGDAGYTDADGYLFLVDRLKDMIISGGENVYSVEVEHAIAAHEAVSEVAVIGLSDELWGERIHAVVVPRAGAALDPDVLLSHCRKLIAGYKVPKTVEIRTEPLPKSGAGEARRSSRPPRPEEQTPTHTTKICDAAPSSGL